jgi:NTP-dependent ternary system trypsin peptidase co-occuring protein
VNATRIVPVEINEQTIYVEATVIDEEEQEIAGQVYSLDGVAAAVGEISRVITDSLKQIRPKKVVAEFGCEIAAETGGLTALLVKGSGKASIKVSLE